MNITKAQNDVGENLSAAVLGENPLQRRGRPGPDKVYFDLRKFFLEACLYSDSIRGVHRRVKCEFRFFLRLLKRSGFGKETRTESQSD